VSQAREVGANAQEEVAMKSEITITTLQYPATLIGDLVVSSTDSGDYIELSTEPGAEPLRIIVSLEDLLASHVERKS
jgi:hypothetical protein